MHVQARASWSRPLSTTNKCQNNSQNEFALDRRVCCLLLRQGEEAARRGTGKRGNEAWTGTGVAWWVRVSRFTEPGALIIFNFCSFSCLPAGPTLHQCQARFCCPNHHSGRARSQGPQSLYSPHRSTTSLSHMLCFYSTVLSV